MGDRIKIEDIAKYCNCSTATVARVVRSSGYVSDEKRRAVEDAIVKFGYVPKQSAKTMALPNARIIALFMNNGEQPLFGRLADGIFREAIKHDYYVLTLHVDAAYNAAKIMKTIDALRQYNISGVIFSSLGDVIDFMPIRRYLQTLPIPIVMMERVADIFNINKVLINAREGMFLAVQCLADAGHTRIALFNPDTDTKVESSRVEGFKTAIRTFGMESCCKTVSIPDYREATGYAAIEEYLKKDALPTALIAADSVLAGIMRYFYQHGIRVPQDVSLVGMDDTYSHLLAPQLTTISFPENEMCKTAVDMILDHANQNSGHTAREVILSPWLHERESVAAPRS